MYERVRDVQTCAHLYNYVTLKKKTDVDGSRISRHLRVHLFAHQHSNLGAPLFYGCSVRNIGSCDSIVVRDFFAVGVSWSLPWLPKRYGVLQCVAVFCSVLQCVLQCAVVCCSVLQSLAVCSVLQCVTLVRDFSAVGVPWGLLWIAKRY